MEDKWVFLVFFLDISDSKVDQGVSVEAHITYKLFINCFHMMLPNVTKIGGESFLTKIETKLLGRTLRYLGHFHSYFRF